MIEKFHESEQVNQPHWKRFKLQGKNRYLALRHDNTEVKYYMTGPDGNKIEIVQPDREISQDEPTTATVVAISTDFDHKAFPDVKPGCHIQTVMNTWYTFTRLGQVYASGDAEGIIAVYGWDGDVAREIADAKEQAQQSARDSLERATEEMCAAAAANPAPSVPSLIKVPKWH